MVSSTVNTDVNWSFSMFDFFTLSLWLISLDERGAIPTSIAFLALGKAVKFLWVSRLILVYKVIDM